MEGQLAVAQRVLVKPLVPVDDRRQFPARPLKDIDDALGLVEVVMKAFQQAAVTHGRFLSVQKRPTGMGATKL